MFTIITEIVLQFLLRTAAGLEILTIEKLPSEDSQLVFVSRPSSEERFFFSVKEIKDEGKGVTYELSLLHKYCQRNYR